MPGDEKSLPKDLGKHIGVDKKALWFEALLQSIPEGILIAEPDEVNVLVISKYGYEILAVPSEQILHHPFKNLLERVAFFQVDGETPIPYHEHPLIRVLENGDSAEDDELVLRNAANEYFTVSSKYGPVRSESGEIVAGIFSWMNISSRKKTERELEETTRRLESSNQALEAFSYSAAHDLQEPLRKIIGFSNMLERDHQQALESSGQDLLTRIRNAAQRMQHLIDNLLAYSRVSARGVTPSAVDLNQVLHNVMVEMETAIRETGALVQVDHLPGIQSDPMLMEHVFQNLLENAIKFRRSDTTAQVRVYQDQAGQGRKGWVRIVVEDNGIGFDMEDAVRIFQPFQRLHGRSAYQGSGLGLSIVKKIVEQHGGQIFARSQTGAGTTFFLDLPVNGFAD